MATLVLDSNTKNIKINMAASATTTNPDYVVAYADNTGTSFTEGTADGVLNGTTDVTVVPGVASTRRIIKTITVYNRDTTPVTLNIKYDAGTQRIIAKPTLQAGETWTLDGTFTTGGAIKQTIISPLTTKGDLLVNNGSGDTRLPVGTNDYILTADSTQATGLRWAQNTAASTGKATAISMIFGF
jgi:hypothetical protein